MAWAQTTIAVISLIKALRSSKSQGDGGIGAVLIYQTEMSKIALEKLDNILTDLIFLRLDLSKAIDQIGEKLETARLEGYIDRMESCARLLRFARVTLEDDESIPEEIDKANADLDNAYQQAQLAVGLLRGYCGTISAIAFPSALALLSSLISLTNRGPAVTKFLFEDFRDWGDEICDTNQDKSLANLYHNGLEEYLQRRLVIKATYLFDPGELFVYRKDTLTICELKITRQADGWHEYNHYPVYRGEFERPEDIDIQHGPVDFYPTTLSYGFELIQDDGHGVPRTEFFTVIPKDASTNGYIFNTTKHLQLPAQTTEISADLATRDSKVYKDFYALIQQAPALVDGLNSLRALTHLRKQLLKRMGKTRHEISNLLELM